MKTKCAATILIFFTLIALAIRLHAGVMVYRDPVTNFSSWPGIPFMQTVTNPMTQAVVPESFGAGVGGSASIAQTFTVSVSNSFLEAISIYAGGGSGTGSGTNLTLNLYDLGFQEAPNPSSYGSSIMGGNLLGSGLGLSVSNSFQTTGFYDFIFTGPDEAPLQFGHMYVFEMAGVPGTEPVFWQRSATDTSPIGAAYRNQTWLNGSSALDLGISGYNVLSTNPPPPVQDPSTALVELTVNLGPPNAVSQGAGVRIGSNGSFIQAKSVTFTLSGPNNPNPIPLEFECLAGQGYGSPPPSHTVSIQSGDWVALGQFSGYYAKTISYDYIATPASPSLSMTATGVTLAGQNGATYEVDQTTDLTQSWVPVPSLPGGLITLSGSSASIPSTAPGISGTLFYRAVWVPCP